MSEDKGGETTYSCRDTVALSKDLAKAREKERVRRTKQAGAVHTPLEQQTLALAMQLLAGVDTFKRQEAKQMERVVLAYLAVVVGGKPAGTQPETQPATLHTSGPAKPVLSSSRSGS
jgi:hypothetical protein